MYLEARPESWLEDKKGEFRLAYKEHDTARPNQNMLYCAGALFDAMHVHMQPWRDWDCWTTKVPRGGVSVLARIMPCKDHACWKNGDCLGARQMRSKCSMRRNTDWPFPSPSR